MPVDYKSLYLTLFGEVDRALLRLEQYRFAQEVPLLQCAVDQAVSDLTLALGHAEDRFCQDPKPPKKAPGAAKSPKKP